jgi:hypothetical protein
MLRPRLGASTVASASALSSITHHPIQRQSVIPSAVSRGPAHVNFLDSNPDDVIKPANLIMTPGYERYQEQLMKVSKGGHTCAALVCSSVQLVTQLWLCNTIVVVAIMVVSNQRCRLGL